MIGQVTDIITAAIVADATASSHDTRTVQGSQTVAMQDAAAQGSLQGAIQQQGLANAARSAQTQDEQEQAEQQKRQQEQEQKMNESQVSYMTQELNELMSRINCNLQFKYHKEVDTMSVKMVDKESGKVLKEVPPEEMIQHMIKAKDWLGAFLDKDA